MELQYVSDAQGRTTSVLVPIEDWNKIKDHCEELEQREKPKLKPSDFRGCISKEMAERMIHDIEKGRDQWERDI